MSTNQNSVQIDNKNITISPGGLLLKNGTSRVDPFVDKETGALAFKLPNVEAKNGLETRYVKVEVFRAFSNIPGVPKLDPEDVICEDGNERNVRFTNLKLSKSGLAKVYDDDAGNAYGGDDADSDDLDKEPGDVDSADTSDEGDESQETGAGSREVATDSGDSADGEEVEADGGDDDGTSPQPSPAGEGADETDDEPEEEEPEVTDELDDSDTVYAVKGEGSSFYTLENADGESLLDELNGGKKINGKKNVEAFADENELKILFR